MSSVKVYAIIPARGGSKGVPGKNIRTLSGHPLIAYSIAAARMSSLIDRVVISTDSEEIASIGRAYGGETPFLRPAQLAGDRSPDRDFMLHALQWFQEHEGVVPDFLVHLRPTTPLRDPARVDEAIRLFLAAEGATSLRSGHEAPETPFKWFLRNEEGFFVPIRPDMDIAATNLPRQMLPRAYIPDGYVDVLRTSFILNATDIHGVRMMGYVSPMCREVDTPEDFEYLEYQIGKKGSPLMDFLSRSSPEKK